MNFINIIIISAVLIILVIVIMIITKSLKNVDEKIVEELKAGNNENKIGVFSKLKGWGMSFFEWIIKKTKKNIQSLHSWIIKEKKKNKSNIVKAKDELMIENEDVNIVDYNSKKEDVKEGVFRKQAVSESVNTQQKKIKNDYKNERDNVSVFYDKKKEIPVDSLAMEGNTEDVTEKSGFMKSLFKKNKQNRKVVDIHNNSIEKWSLGGGDDSINDNKQLSGNIKITEVGRKFLKKEGEDDTKNEAEVINNADDNDEMIGVDRRILEKKILQKIDKNPKRLNNYRELGSLYIKMEKLDDALEVFEYVLSVKPRDLVALRKKRKIKLLRRIAK